MEGGSLASTVTMNFQDGRLSGAGTVTGNVSNAATVSPGSLTPGRLNIVGNYTCNPTAILDVRIGGTGVGQFDVLAVTSTATRAGALNVTLVGGYTPSGGERFDVMTFTSGTGSFIPNLPQLPPGLAWDVQYGTNAVTLAVIGAGPRSPVTARSK